MPLPELGAGAAPWLDCGRGHGLQIVTQRCHTQGDSSGEDVAHFSFPVEADLFFCINSLDEDEDVLICFAMFWTLPRLVGLFLYSST